jgi:disulfide bond formation protein DsbB
MSRLYIIAATLNALVLTLILLAALIVQLALGELPCPLCVLQRIALMLCAMGPLYLLAQNQRGALNHRDLAIGSAMSLIGALIGAAISTRQVLLHILPGDPGYGGTVFGLHLYTISLIAFFCQMLATVCMLFGAVVTEAFQQVHWPLAKIVFVAFGLLLLANLLSVVAESGWHWMLPSDPVSYRLFGE